MMVIVGIIPITLLVKEHEAFYKSKGEGQRNVVAREERQRRQQEVPQTNSFPPPLPYRW